MAHEMVNPVTLLGDILRASRVVLATDFEEQLAKFEAYCEELVDPEDPKYSAPQLTHEAIIELLLASGLRIEIWFRGGAVHILSSEVRRERGWTTACDEG